MAFGPTSTSPHVSERKKTLEITFWLSITSQCKLLPMYPSNENLLLPR